MAVRLSDGSIRLANGQILYADSVIQTVQEILELHALFHPPAWPFVSGGGGARGEPGAQGTAGPQGPIGVGPGVLTFQYGVNNQVPGSGTLQLEGPGSTTVGFLVYKNVTLSGASLQVDSPSTNDYELQIRVNNVTVASVPLLSGNTGGFTSGLSVPVAAGSVVTAFVVRTSGSGSSSFSDQQAIITFLI